MPKMTWTFPLLWRNPKAVADKENAMKKILGAGIILLAMAFPALADEHVVCTLVIDPVKSTELIREGSCDERMSPASTFKVPISLMGFDAGILSSADAPKWPFRDGYADWNPKWRQSTTPASWMRDSVVWYSQRITEQLGMERFSQYVTAFDYGNQDVSGDPGKGNGLTRSWLSSSLQISPREQVTFLTKLINGDLPVSVAAITQTKGLMGYGVHGNGWQVFGKTGAGTPFGADGQLQKEQQFGWYVGWAEKDDDRIVFARLMRLPDPQGTTAGILARDGLIKELTSANGLLH